MFSGLKILTKIFFDTLGIQAGTTPSPRKRKISVTKKRVGDTIFVIKRKKRVIKKKDLSPDQALQKQQAKIILTDRLQELSKFHNLPYGRSFIRDQKSKWGSCSRKIIRPRRDGLLANPIGRRELELSPAELPLCNISLNRRLSLMPDHIRDYVILHELAHTKHMNHSKDFWKFLEILCPERKVAEQWLKEHGMKYM